MKRTMVLLMIFAIVSVCSTAYGEVKLQKNGFTVELPADWVDIPREAIDAYESALAKLVPAAQAQHFDYGFQLAGKKDWFEYPYVLIQVKNVGRIPENQLQELEGVSVQKALDDQKDSFSTVMSDIQVGKMLYDGKANIIWMRMEFTVHDVGPVKGISGMVPTERGFIQTSGYCSRDDYQKYEPVFRSIASSVVPGPALAYKPKHLERKDSAATGINWVKVAGAAAGGAVLGGIITLLVRLRKQKGQ